MKNWVKVSFIVKQTEDKISKILAPTPYFIEGCLIDLNYTHGLKCENIIILEEKEIK